MKINRELIKERARDIRQNIAKIRRYVVLPDAEFFADERNLLAVLHLLLITIEATGRICAHLLAREAARSPASFAECMQGLGELGIIDVVTLSPCQHKRGEPAWQRKHQNQSPSPSSAGAASITLKPWPT